MKPTEIKEIDNLVDTLVEEKDKAEELKDVLHRKLADEQPEAKAKSKPVSIEDSADDLWDNVPV